VTYARSDRRKNVVRATLAGPGFGDSETAKSVELTLDSGIPHDGTTAPSASVEESVRFGENVDIKEVYLREGNDGFYLHVVCDDGSVDREEDFYNVYEYEDFRDISARCVPELDSAREFIADLNPDVYVETHETRLTAENVGSFLAEYDLVVDGSDNFPTRYLVNDACTLAGVPFCHGAILRFEGQVTTFAAADGGPCYRCLFPEAPEPGTVPDCATAGVLGVLPGTVGCIQATEAVKLALGYGETLDGRMVFYDAAAMSFEEIPVDPRPDCPVCGEDGIQAVHDVAYEATCRI